MDCDTIAKPEKRSGRKGFDTKSLMTTRNSTIIYNTPLVKIKTESLGIKSSFIVRINT